MHEQQLSKTIAHALRHDPGRYGLVLNEDGWTSAGALLAALRQRRPAWWQLTEADLERLVARSAKKRYELKDGRIRALYGHSTDAKLRHEAIEPPATLFHGTAPATAAIILQEGLKPMGRQYVHLSVDVTMARQVGWRKGEAPAILQIWAQDAHADGVLFYQGNPFVWLADFVPAHYIVRLEAAEVDRGGRSP